MNSTAWRVSCTLGKVFVSGIMAAQKARLVWREWRMAASPFKFTILLLRAHPKTVLPLSHQQAQVTIATISLCRKNSLPLARRATRPTALTIQICHLDGYNNADAGWQFAICVSVLSPRTKSSTRWIARTRLLVRLASWVALLATSLLQATVSERSRVSARTRALPA